MSTPASLSRLHRPSVTLEALRATDSGSDPRRMRLLPPTVA